MSQSAQSHQTSALGRTARALRSAPPPSAPGEPRWSALLWPPLCVSAGLLLCPQAIFLWMSFHKSTGFGQLSDTLSLSNYATIFSDTFYLRALWVTFRISFIATFVSLLFALPSAYFLARLRSRIVEYLLILLLTASFVSVVVKVLGLTLLLGDAGILNGFLQNTGLIGRPVHLLGNETGVIIGFIQHTLPLQIVLLFSVVQTVPSSIEEAAEISGARWPTVMLRVVLPALRPGIVSCCLIAFSLNMGSFTTAILLGGGRVPMLPVLIQQKIITDVDYGFGSALSSVLLVVVFLLNWLFTIVSVGRRPSILKRRSVHA